MKLRNFYYINKKLLEDYIAAIEGYTYEEETQKINETSQKAAGAKAGVFGVTGDGKYEKQSSEEKERKVHISDAAKFEKLFVYLSDNEDTPLLHYEMLNSEIFDSLHRDDFIEVLVTPRFSKMKELSDTVKKISSLAEVFETITQQSILDKKSEEAITGISALGNLKSESGISCVFSFEDNQFPVSYTHLDVYKRQMLTLSAISSAAIYIVILFTTVRLLVKGFKQVKKQGRFS